MEDRNEILKAARDAGYGDTKDQLGRLRRAQAIPQPRIVRRGRKGTMSLYPPGTKERFLKLLAHRERRRIRERDWRLWWADGGALSPAAREFLEENARSFDRVSRFLGRLIAREDLGSAAAERRMDHLYESAENSRLSGPLAAVRRRVGRRAFSTVVRLLTQIGSGRFSGYPGGDVSADGTPVPGTTAALIEKALGLDRARSDGLADAPPWYSGSSERDLVRLSRLLIARPLPELAAEPDDVLESARRDLQAFVRVVRGTAKLAEPLLGRNAFGFPLFARFLTTDRPGNQVTMVLGWVSLSKEQDLQRGMQEMVALEPQVRLMEMQHDLLDALRIEIPAFATVLSNRNIGKALRSQAHAKQLARRIEDVRDREANAVDAFLARHTDTAALLSAAHGG